MGFRIKQSNWRVEVSPECPEWRERDCTPEQWKRACDDVKSLIKRHIDGITSVYVECDTELVCEHCGSAWTEGNKSPHNGGCCGKDCEVFEATEAQGKQD